jgi:GNAT superfamily N-acetyltransferase
VEREGGREGGRAGGGRAPGPEAVEREGNEDEEAFDEYAAWHYFTQQSWHIRASAAPSCDTLVSLPPSLPPSPSLSFRPYVPRTGDRGHVLRLVEEGREGAKEGRPSVVSFVAKSVTKDLKLLEAGLFPGRFWLVVEGVQEGKEEGRIVGCVGVRVLRREGKKGEGGEAARMGRPVGEVVRLSVRKDKRGRGIGLRMLDYVEEFARLMHVNEKGRKASGRGEHGDEKEGEEAPMEGGREPNEGNSEGPTGVGLSALRATTLGEDALPGALSLYVKRAGWVVERETAYGKEGEVLYHLCKQL